MIVPALRNALGASYAAGVLALCFAHPIPAAAQEPAFCLTILHNNDAESRVVDAGAGLEDFGGAARFVSLLKQERQDAAKTGCAGLTEANVQRGTIVLSSGDNFLAGPEIQASTELPEDGFYDTRVIDRAGYDALAIGNHEFDFGPDFLASFLADTDSPIPFLSANLDFSGEPELQALVEAGKILPSVIVDAPGGPIGVIGATTTNLALISSPGEVATGAVETAIQREVERLQADGVTMIILISHLQAVDEDLQLVPEIEGIDVAIAGGGDEVLANEDDVLVPGDEENVFGPYPLIATRADGTEIPVVTTAGSFKYVGRLDVLFDAEGNVLNFEGGPVRVAGGDHEDAVEPDPVIQETVVEPVVAYNEELANTIIGTSQVALNGMRADVRTKETNLGNLIADAHLTIASERAAEFGAPTPDIAIQNGGGIRNDTEIAAGPVTALNTFEILPFPNFLVVIEGVTPEILKLILENAVSNVENVDGRFAQVAGFSFVYDPDAAPQTQDDEGNVLSEGERVISATLEDGTPIIENGEPIAEAPALNLATIDFLARGGDGYPFGDLPFTVLAASYQQALDDYIQVTLSGQISSTDYPTGGEGRITTN